MYVCRRVCVLVRLFVWQEGWKDVQTGTPIESGVCVSKYVKGQICINGCVFIRKLISQAVDKVVLISVFMRACIFIQIFVYTYIYTDMHMHMHDKC